EDTFTLMDTLEEDLTRNKLKDMTPCMVLEVGVGSGMVLNFLGKLIKRRLEREVVLMGTDINPYALRKCQENGKLNELTLNLINCNLVSSLRMGIKLDIIVFNPPYVETEDNEVFSSDKVYSSTKDTLFDDIITATWAGGKFGRRVIDQFMTQVKELLADKGVFYLVTVAENKPVELIEEAKEIGLVGEILKIRKAGREKLYILKFIKK
ncbi:S-adenosyl-L-methionine-dependent methyltransferase, partial [Neoconidiobolus thromboides FSU 785]